MKDKQIIVEKDRNFLTKMNIYHLTMFNLTFESAISFLIMLLKLLHLRHSNFTYSLFQDYYLILMIFIN